jgi:VCBS repeat-containing protein
MMVAAARRETRNRAIMLDTAARTVAAGGVPDAEKLPAAAAAAVVGGDSVHAVTPATAEVSVDPITAIVQQVQAVISGIVEAVAQFVNQVVTVVNQIVTAIVNIFVPVAPVNSAPTATNPTVGIPDSVTGAVTGVVSATDTDGDILTYSAPASTSKGSIAIDSSTGAFTYAPTVSARENAAKVGATDADKADSFVVTVTDGRGGSTDVSVAVVISPLATAPTNSAPTAGASTVGVPDAITGVVTGKVNASDPDGDSLTFSAPASTSKGGAVIDVATGEFTYTPSLSARENAAKVGATDADKSDSFTVTVADGKGGSVAVVIAVAISPLAATPANSAPVAGTVTVSVPDAMTGVVTGKINASDTDGDPLTYTVPVSTGKGAVGIDVVTGVFTYTPTVAARQNAAKVGATDADKSDTFTVTVSDGQGGSTTALVTVAVAPVVVTPGNNSPVAGTVTVGLPDPSTGVAVGQINATDPDGDTLAYSGTQTTSKGEVVVEADGSFTYTPSPTARHNAARDGAGAADLADAFTLTVSDGKGGSTAVPVTVSIAPVNVTPVAGEVSISPANTETGVLSGVITAIDADGDALTYSGSATTSRGVVVVNADGSFTYTPNDAARDNLGTVVLPRQAFIGPDYARAYVFENSVVNQAWLATVSVIDIASNVVTQTIPFNMAVQGMGISPDGAHTFLVNNTSDVLAVDLDTGTVIATISTPNYPYDFAFSPDSSRAYVRTNSGIVAIDTATNDIVATISSPNPFNLVVSPDGARVYGASNDGLLVFDTASNTLATIIPTGAVGRVALSSDGSRAYGMGDASVVVVDTATDTIIRTIPARITSGGMAADDTYVYVTVSDPISRWIAVSMIDPATGDVIAIADLPDGMYAYNLTVRPGGLRGVYASTDSTGTGESAVVFIPFDQPAIQARTDTFTVTISDGHGGSVPVPISVPIVP